MNADGISQTGPEGGQTLDGGAAQQALERRYRRLLRCYPPLHREVHREEMLGVLLAAALPGQRAPGARQTVNLVACGLAIWARRALSWLAGPWQDALAVVSLIAPVLMLIIATLDAAVAVREAVANHLLLADHVGVPAVPFWQLSLVPLLGGPAAVMIGWLAVVLLGLTGRRRAAAGIASIPLTLALLDLLTEVMQLSGAWSGGLPLFLNTAGAGPAFIASLAACSLAFSAGPRRGLAIVGRRRACLMLAGLAGSFGFPAIVVLLRPSAPLAASTFSLLGVLAIAVTVAVTRPRSTVDRRVAVLTATGLLLTLANAFPPMGDLTVILVFRLGSLLFAVLVWPVVIASWRGQVGRASRGNGRTAPAR